MMRTAISPRLAIRSRRNSGAPMSLRKDGRSVTAAGATSERDVAMLLSRVGVPLRLQHLERTDDARPRLGGPDDVVDVPTPRGDVRVREFRLIRSDEPSALPHRIVRCREFVLVDDVHGALSAHDGNLGRWPGEVDVAADVLARHDVVRAAV